MSANFFWTLDRMNRVFALLRAKASNAEIGAEMGVLESAVAKAISEYDPYTKKPSYACCICNRRINLTGFPTHAEATSHAEKCRSFARRKRVSCGGECEKALRGVIVAQNRANMPTSETSIEVAIRAVLDDMGVAYVAQRPISSFVCDFYIPNGKIVIECQGTFHHADPRVYSDPDKLYPLQVDKIVRDERKRTFLSGAGYHLIELWQNEIDNDLPACIDRITEAIDQHTAL